MEELTHSTIYQSAEEVEIEKEILGSLSEVTRTNNILSIYSMNARAIYFFPVASDVFKLSIQIYPLTPEIVAKIMNNISKIATKVVYSTGLCLVENRCFWEGFLQEKDLTIDVDDIESSLSSISEVTAITIEKVNRAT